MPCAGNPSATHVCKSQPYMSPRTIYETYERLTHVCYQNVWQVQATYKYHMFRMVYMYETYLGLTCATYDNGFTGDKPGQTEDPAKGPVMRMDAQGRTPCPALRHTQMCPTLRIARAAMSSQVTLTEMSMTNKLNQKSPFFPRTFAEEMRTLDPRRL